MAVRDLPKAEAARDGILESVPDADLELRELDLASLASVRAFTKAYLADRSSLDLLIGNAGIMACPQGATVDGFELQFGTNHLGHFLLCRELLPLVSHPARGWCCSARRATASVTSSLDDWNFEQTPYDPWVAYGRSKTANVLCAVALDAPARRARRAGDGRAPRVHHHRARPPPDEGDVQGRCRTCAPRARSRSRRPSSRAPPPPATPPPTPTSRASPRGSTRTAARPSWSTATSPRRPGACGPTPSTPIAPRPSGRSPSASSAEDDEMRFTYAEAMTDVSFYGPLAQAAEEAGFDGFLSRTASATRSSPTPPTRTRPTATAGSSRTRRSSSRSR